MKSLIATLLLSTTLFITTLYANSTQDQDIIDSELIIKDSKYKLVFFGYAGCYHFCDPRLNQIHPIYEEVKKSLDIKMLFIDISDTTSLKEAQTFVKAVNNEFEAINPDISQIKILQKKFQDVYIRKLDGEDYLHSGFLYLLKKHNEKYTLLKIYVDFRNTGTVIADILKISGK